MTTAAKTVPATFFAVCAQLIHVKLTVEQSFAGLDPTEYAVLAAIKEAIPDANSREPSAVLEYVLNALARPTPRMIDCTEKPSGK